MRNYLRKKGMTYWRSFVICLATQQCARFRLKILHVILHAFSVFTPFLDVTLFQIHVAQLFIIAVWVHKIFHVSYLFFKKKMLIVPLLWIPRSELEGDISRSIFFLKLYYQKHTAKKKHVILYFLKKKRRGECQLTSRYELLEKILTDYSVCNLRTLDQWTCQTHTSC